MEILFLGSGAAEFWPSPFCECRNCTEAMEKGLPGRMGACVMVDRTFLFDLPPNLPLAAHRLKTSLAQVRHIFVTHSHQDHFDPCTLTATRRDPEHPLHLYCNRRVADLLPFYAQFNRFFDIERLGIVVHTLDPFNTVTGQENGVPFELTPLRADHDTTGGEEPLIYIFRQNGKTLLYACDTGWFPDETWQAIEKHRFDLVLLDCTRHLMGECRRGHLSAEPFIEVLERFRSGNLLKPEARFVAHHLNIAHGDGGLAHQDLAEHFRSHGVDVAYDGLEMEITPPAGLPGRGGRLEEVPGNATSPDLFHRRDKLAGVMTTRGAMTFGI